MPWSNISLGFTSIEPSKYGSTVKIDSVKTDIEFVSLAI